MDLRTLHSLGNQPAPSDVISGWNLYCEMTPDAQRDLWAILEPGLLLPPGQEQQERGAAFCEKYGINLEALASVVQACGLLFQQAASHDLSVELFQEDLSALSETAGSHVDLMVSRYASVKRSLRQSILAATLADQGKLLTGVHWSTEQLSASDRGTALDATVVRLTLQYVDGAQAERITLQLTPDSIRELKAFTDRFGGGR